MLACLETDNLDNKGISIYTGPRLGSVRSLGHIEYTHIIDVTPLCDHVANALLVLNTFKG